MVAAGGLANAVDIIDGYNRPTAVVASVILMSLAIMLGARHRGVVSLKGARHQPSDPS